MCERRVCEVVCVCEHRVCDDVCARRETNRHCCCANARRRASCFVCECVVVARGRRRCCASSVLCEVWFEGVHAIGCARVVFASMCVCWACEAPCATSCARLEARLRVKLFVVRASDGAWLVCCCNSIVGESVRYKKIII